MNSEEKTMAREEVEIKIISRETIKPSLPTPQHLKTFKLSILDQVAPSHLYTSLILFYQLPHHDQYRHLLHLKSSLSETLTRFYPLAGRSIRNEVFIDCTDTGADFIEAKVSGRLSDVLEHPDPTFLSKLVPCSAVSVENAAAGRVLLVQANLFECGGIAVGLCMSHKICDASTMSLFIKGWAAQARGAGDSVVPDMTALASRFPSISLPADAGLDLERPNLETWLPDDKPCQTRRFVYDSKSIKALRAKARSASVEHPSRVGVVTGHIWLSLMKLYSRNTKVKSYNLIQPIGLRKRVDPPISEDSVGNCGGISIAEAHKNEEKAIELEGLVRILRSQLQNATKYYSENIGGQETFFTMTKRVVEVGAALASDDVKAAMITSWCKLWLYENGDFGWGKPAWVSHLKTDVKDMVILLDAKVGDGIEAWVTLAEHDMDFLERDQDFLQFASLNPSIDDTI